MRPHLRARAARHAGAVYTDSGAVVSRGGEGGSTRADAHRRARADEVPVAVDVVDAPHGGPELESLT